MALSSFIAAIQQISSEKNIPEEKVQECVEAAIAAAYRRDYGEPTQNIKVKLKPDRDTFDVFQVFEVMESEEAIEEKDRQITLEDAKAITPDAEVGQEVTIPLPFHDDFGRIAAQTAKQVIIQRIREIEREILYEEFKDKENKLLNGSVQQQEGDNVIISLGKVNAVLPLREQVKGERYSTGQRIKVYIKDVYESNRGPQIIASRTDAEFIRGLFEIEVPEIQAGTIEIKSIAREAGSRTKMIVYSSNPSLDPVGSCVGRHHTRVDAVLAEIGEEKIDIILWDDDPAQLICNALSPAKKVEVVSIDEENKQAQVEVDPDQLSLAIGKSGQNVRLASRVTGYDITILREPEEADKAKSEPEETA